MLKKYGESKIHLVDYFGQIDIETMKMILSFSLNFAKNENISYFSFWHKFSSQSNSLHNVFDELGFTLKKSDEFFGIKKFKSFIDKILKDKSNWHITMSDNDIF